MCATAPPLSQLLSNRPTPSSPGNVPGVKEKYVTQLPKKLFYAVTHENGFVYRRGKSI